MSANQDRRDVDTPEMGDTASVTRYDDVVRDQFVWEVGETLELVRTVSMAGSRIDGVSAAEILATCVDNLADLGETLGLTVFIEAVEQLRGVVQFDPFDGALVDKHIDQVQQARWLWPGETGTDA